MIVRALDHGFGATKFTIGDYLPGNLIPVSTFSSIVRRAQQQLAGEQLIRQTDTPFLIEIDGVSYRAGPGIEHTLGDDTRTLDARWIDSPEFYCLSLAALRCMNLEVIDHLVVGVPIGAPRAREQALKDLLIGEHDLRNGKNCRIGEVHVLSQGLGAYLDYQATLLQLQHEPTHASGVSLIIDVGHCTADWLVVVGTSIDHSRSGSTTHGAGGCLEQISRAIAEQGACSKPDTTTLEKAFRAGRADFNHAGIDFDLKVLRDAAANFVHVGMTTITRGVRTLDDITDVLLFGGGSSWYAEAAQRALPHARVSAIQESEFANCRGFHRLVHRQVHRG